MKDQQKKSVSGAEEVLNNSERYKLVDANAYIDAIEGRRSFRESLRIERIKSDRLAKENEQLLNMLKSIVDSINTDTYPLGKIAAAKIGKAKLLIKGTNP